MKAGVGPGATPGRENILVTFRDATRRSGIKFTHRFDLKNAKMIGTQGGGAAFADFDGDGWLDLYCVNSVAVDRKVNKKNCGVLWRNEGPGADGIPRFRDVTRDSGIQACGWGQGAYWADIDGDGDPDLFQTNFGKNQLWINGGPGAHPRFEDVSAVSGLGATEGFHVGAGFFDADNDGDVDVYVGDYLITDLAIERKIGIMDIRIPEDYAAAPNHFFRNEGNGTFTERTAEAGLEDPDGKSLGIAPYDFDGDGWTDLYVANDKTPNALFHNNRDGTFTDMAVDLGCAFDENGLALSGMGLAIGDFDEDTRPDIFVTNYANEWNTLYHALEGGGYEDATGRSGLGAPSYERVGWGTGAIDFDNDGKLDLYVNNGNIIPRWLIRIVKLFARDKTKIKLYDVGRTFKQAPLLFRGHGDGTFEDVTSRAGALGKVRVVGRGSAAGDVDNDGDVDIFLLNTASFPWEKRPSRLLLNEGGNQGHAVAVRLVPGADRKTVLGSRVELEAGDGRWVKQWQIQPAFASGSDALLWFGLGAASRVTRLTVRWPDGASTLLEDMEAGVLWRISNHGPARIESRFAHR